MNNVRRPGGRRCESPLPPPPLEEVYEYSAVGGNDIRTASAVRFPSGSSLPADGEKRVPLSALMPPKFRPKPLTASPAADGDVAATVAPPGPSSFAKTAAFRTEMRRA